MPEQTNPLLALATAATTTNKAVIESLRARADTTAKAFGALATTAVTAIGFAKLGDLFPRPPGLVWPIVLGLIGFVLMLLAVAFFTARLWGVAQPILARSDPALMDDLRGSEEPKIVNKVYMETAANNRAPSLRAYSARGRRYESIAQRRPEADAAKLRAEAATIYANASSSKSRAGALVVRWRAGQVVKSKMSALFFAAFAVGVLMFALSADRVESARAGEVEVAKACAEARTANAVKLPAICGDEPPDPEAAVALAKACAEARTAKAIEATLPSECGTAPSPETPPVASADETADAALTALVEARAECRAAFREGEAEGADPCLSLDRAIIEALTAPPPVP